MIISHYYVIITKGFIITHYYTFPTDKLADVKQAQFTKAWQAQALTLQERGQDPKYTNGIYMA